MANKIKGTGKDDLLSGTNKDDVIIGNAGDDVLSGGNGNDRLKAGSGDDVLKGGKGDDILIGGKGADVMKGGAGDDKFKVDGDDIIVGGKGNDTVVIKGNFADATVTETANGYQIVTANGTVTVSGIEFVKFDDQTVDAANLVSGEEFTLTVNDETFIGTAGNDTFTAAAGTANAGDIIIDQSTTDNDTLNITETGDVAAISVSGVENINVNITSLASQTIEAANIVGGTISVSRGDLADGQIKGNTSVVIDDLGATTDVVAGENVATLTVNLAKGGASIDAGEATSVTVTGIDKDGVTIDAASATSVALSGTGTATDVANVSVAGTVALDVDGGNLVETVNLSASDAATVTLSGTTTASVLNLSGESDIALVADAGEIDGTKLTSSATGMVSLKVTGADDVDLTNWAAIDSINLASNLGNKTVTVVSGSNVSLSSTQGDLTVSGVAASAATNTLALSTADNGSATTGITASSVTVANVKTVSLDATAESFTATNGFDVGTASLTLTGDKAINLGLTTAATVNAAAATGAITLTANDDMTSLTTGSGKDVLEIDNSKTAMAVVSGDGDDNVTVTTALAGSTILTGAGNDTINLDEAAKIVVNAGEGDDTVNLSVASDGVISGGAGSDTLNVVDDADVSANTQFAISGFEAIDVADTKTFTLTNVQFASNGTFTLSGDGTLAITAAGATSGVTLNASTITPEFGSNAVVELTGSAFADTITGTITGDTITGGAGADKLTGGLGADTFVFVATDSSATATDAITDFVGGADKIEFAAADHYNDLSATNFSGASDLAAAATAAIVADNATNGTDGDVDAILFKYNGSSYFVVQTDGDAATYDAAHDLLVEVTGLTGTITAADFI